MRLCNTISCLVCIVFLLPNCRTVRIDSFISNQSDENTCLVIEVENRSSEPINIPEALIVSPDSLVNMHGFFLLEKIIEGKHHAIFPAETDYDLDFIYLQEILDGQHLRKLNPKNLFSYSLYFLDFYHEIESGTYVLSLCLKNILQNETNSLKCFENRFEKH